MSAASARGTDGYGTAPRVAYLMSRFPKLSETFVLYEILALEESGVEVQVYPLLRHREAVIHPEAQRLMGRVRYQPFLSGSILRANLRALLTRPGPYVRTVWGALRGTVRSRNFFFGALGILPKTVRAALQMEAEGVRHVHAHFATHPALAAWMIHRLTGIPYSFTAHGSDLHVDRTMLRDKVRDAELVVAISEFNRAMIVTEAPEHAHKVHVVHCGADCRAIVPGTRGSEATRPLRVLCVASLGRVKGHRHLLAAVRQGLDRGVSLECVLVGDGPERAALERQIAELGLERCVQVLGAQPRPRVLEELGRADVFALTSHPTARGQKEGIPVALMEAMASSLPVISTVTGGIPELVLHERTGILVEPGDVDGIADALVRLARDAELRQRMGRAGRSRVESSFDLRANAATLATLFLAPHSEAAPRAAVRATAEVA